MSKQAGAKARDRVPPQSHVPGGSREPSLSLPPLQPRRHLFYGLLTALVLWVGVLLGLYAFTVYPNRAAHSERVPPPVAPESSATSPAGAVSRAEDAVTLFEPPRMK